ncbi:MAG: 30S ribosomal protein S17 [Candidatus Micrarchaeota archaeon]|nr:30S ribosomal protein S17 [Candidatus Micrarchaeota archaeon]
MAEEKTAVQNPLRVRGLIIEGLVVSTRPKKTAIIQIAYTKKVPKYERLEKRKSRIAVHVPEGMDVKVGQRVRAGQTRKISKTKSFLLMEILG